MTEPQRSTTAENPATPVSAATSAGNSKAGKKGKPARKAQVPGEMSHRQILQALTGLLAALFTAMLSTTIVANALPTIMADLHGTQTDFAWVVTAALLANAVSTPIWGKLADLFSKKLLVQLSIIIFVIGSVVAGFADNMPVLLTARVIQGIGMGGLTALVQAVIGSIIPPRERGRYSGYMGAVMAVATAGGPLLGGFIVDSPLGWRWTFFLCVPLAVVALFLLQVTLRLPHTRRKVSIDWLGSILLTAGVSLLLIWVSFAGKAGYYDWMSWQTAAMVGTSIVLLALLVLVESKVREPIIPLKIIRERTTALSIVASVAVGIAMFGSTTFLGQYFQIARGYSPTEAGLLMLPMIAGNLMGSVGSGQLISRFGKWKRFLIAGTIMVIAGTGLAGSMNHETDMLLVSLYIFVLGLGMGLLMQNLVLAVQNTVKVSEVGSASASIAFFRTVGGAVGVSVLGAVMSSSVSSRAADGLRAANIPVTDGGAGDSLDIGGLPEAVQGIFRAAYGDATATIFQIAAVISVVALIAVLFIKEQVLRRTLDIQPTAKMPVEPGLTGGSEMVNSGAMSTVPAAAAGPSAVSSPAASPAAEPDDGGQPGRGARSRTATGARRSSSETES